MWLIYVVFRIRLQSNGTLFERNSVNSEKKKKRERNWLISTQSRFKWFIEVFFFCCFFFFAGSYTKPHKRNQAQSSNCVGSRSLSLSQSTELILLGVIVPCLMLMMSWLVLFSGALLWRVCSPAVVNARLTLNPLCLSRQQQTDWSGLAEAHAVRRGNSTLARGLPSSRYTSQSYAVS